MIRIIAGNPKAIDLLIRDGANNLVTNLQDARAIRFQVKRDRLDTVEEALISYESHPTVQGEVVYTGDGSPVPPFTLASAPVVAGSVAITDGVETFNDDGHGVLSGSLGGTGNIEYTSGDVTLTFTTPPAVDVEVTANYQQASTDTLQFDTPKQSWLRVYILSEDTQIRPGEYYFAVQIEWPTERVEMTIGDGVLSVQQDTIR